MSSNRPYEEKLGIIALMMQMSAKDGEKSPAELRFIAGVCELYNIHIEDISPDLLKQKEFEFSNMLLQRIADLQAILLLMFIDKKLDAEEVKFCMEIALKMGIRPEVVNRIIDTMSEEDGKPVEAEVLKELHLAHTN